MDTISGLQSQPAPPLEWRETRDLRKRLIYSSRAVHYPYARPASTPKQTTGLKVGSQAKLIAAAFRANKAGHPINTLLSIRWQELLSYDDIHPFRAMQTPARIRHLVELVRKWLSYRGIPAYYLWARELSHAAGEHWHLALHLPKSRRGAFINYLESVLIEPVAPRPRAQSKRTRGEFACGEYASWHLAGEEPDGKPYFIGYWLAAYLGKGEPSQRMFRSKLIDNTLKPVRGREFGGKIKGGRYDVPQGNISGSTTRKGRFDIARSLK